jgi:FAD:protein FMN transferase
MRLRGTRRVGIRHPLERQAIAAVVEATDLALATSGEYARGGHVLDPHTGAAPSGILSATISRADLAARLRGYGALLILDDERVLTTPSFGCAPRSPRSAPACPPRS